MPATRQAFCGAGALGFYPWMDRSRSHYGVLARQSGLGESHAAYHSAQCGRLIRQARKTDKPVTATTPSLGAETR